jgi:hypothetical protein
MPGAYRSADATVSAQRATAVTLSDSTTIQNTRALFIGGAGNVKVSMVEGGDVTFTVPAGTLLPIQVVKVWSTGTTVSASLIIALY